MRVAVVTVQTPFVTGGAELHAAGLVAALERAGHAATLVAIPFNWQPAERILDHMLACRLLDLGGVPGVPIDRVIALKFPAYLVTHPQKVVWLLHQHRPAYDLWDGPYSDLIADPRGAEVREAIHAADRQAFGEARRVFTNSGNVAARLERFCGIDASPLYHPPPGADRLAPGRQGDYLFFPSRLTRIKRQALVLEALALCREPVKVRFAGMPEDAGYEAALRARTRELGLGDRVEWLGQLSEADKRALYADALGVIYPPTDEDYGYVTLEAMLCAKPVVTCSDSGGPLELVADRAQGRVVAPEPKALAAALDELWSDRAQARRWGEAGAERYRALEITWPRAVEALLG